MAADYLAATQPSGELADGYRYEFWPVNKKTAARVSSADLLAFVAQTAATDPEVNCC